MSTTSAGPTLRGRSGSTALQVTQIRVIASEWTKFRSLRSTVWTLLIAVILTVGVGLLFCLVSNSQYHSFTAAQLANFDPIATSMDGTLFTPLAVGVLGVLLISGEYSTGMIRSSLTVVPQRLPVLWGKLMVFAAITFVVMLAACLAAFFLGQLLLTSHGLNVPISAPGAFRSVVGAALYVTLAGLIGMAVGSLLRNTAAGISGLVGLFFVLPIIAQILPASISAHFVKFLPSNAGSAMFGRGSDLVNTLAPWAGFGVLCGYVVILTGVGAWRLKTVDV